MDAEVLYINIVVQLHSPRAVKLYLLQRLSDNVVWLPLRGLRRLDHGGLVEVALVISVQLAESILQLEDLVLLELRIFPECLSVMRRAGAEGGVWTDLCSLITFMSAT